MGHYDKISEDFGVKLLKGFESILNAAFDNFRNDFRNDLKIICDRVAVGFDQSCEKLDESSMAADFAEPKQEQMLTAINDLKVFDKRVMRKNEAKYVVVKDGEAMMEDESMETNGDLPSPVAPSSVEHPTQQSSMPILVKTMMAEGLDASIKGCIQSIQVTFQPSPFLAQSHLLGSSNLNLNRVPKVIEKPNWNLEGIVDSVTGISMNELNLNLVHSVKLKLNRNISKLNFARNVYLTSAVLEFDPMRGTSIVGGSMIRRTPNEIGFDTVIGKLSGSYALRGRLEEFIYELEGD